MEPIIKDKVLVTGISGFLGSHVGRVLLEKGYTVRGTVRDLKNEKKLKPLKILPHQERLELVAADLLKPDSWDAAVAGCTMVAHVASPFPSAIPKDPNQIIRPAVEGTMAVLKACARHKEVRAVVITSSIAAVQSLGKNAKVDYTEADWADIATIPPYNQSKTLAEKAAWDFYNGLDKSTRFKLTTINPGLILGPAYVAGDFTSGEIIRQFLVGDAFALPRVNFGLVDVRDVAAAHVAALESTKSDGQRYMCVSEDHLWLEDIAGILREEFGKYGYKVTSRKVRYCSVRFVAFFSSAAKALLPFIGKYAHFSNEKIKADLGINFISGKEAILKMAYSLIENGIVPNRIAKVTKKS